MSPKAAALPLRCLHAADFAGDAWEVAPRLIGATLLVNGVGGLIVETAGV